MLYALQVFVRVSVKGTICMHHKINESFFYNNRSSSIAITLQVGTFNK